MKLPFSGLLAEFKEFAFKGNMIELAVAVIIGGAFGTVVTSLTNDVIMPTIGYVINKGEQAAATAHQAVNAVAAKTGITAPTTAPATQPAAVGTAAPAVPTVPAMPSMPDVKSDAPLPEALVIVKALEAHDDEVAKAKADADAKAAAAAEAKAKAAEPIKIDLNVGPIPVGKFIGALLNFVIVAFAVFIMVVKLMGGVMKKMSKPAIPGEPTERECPECLSIIPIKAKRCSHCTAVVAPIAAT
jgi:large-conductance mechanosensitive channel